MAQRDAEVASLQAHLGRLLGVSDADVPALHRARFGPQTSAAQPPDRAAAARIAALEVSKLPWLQPGLRNGSGLVLGNSQSALLGNCGRLPTSGWRWRWWRPPVARQQRQEVPALLPSHQLQAARQTLWQSCRRSWRWPRGAFRRLTNAWRSWRSC